MLCIFFIFEQDDEFYDAQVGTVFGADTDVSDLPPHFTDLKLHGHLVKLHNKSSFIPCNKLLSFPWNSDKTILTKWRIDLGRLTNGSSHHCLPTRHTDAHDVHNVVR
jgi:hypothetical protein